MPVRKRLLRPLMMAATLSTSAANAEMPAFYAERGAVGRGVLAPVLDDDVCDPSLPARPARDWKVPRSIMAGLLARETRSKLSDADSVTWVDRKRGLHGERGPTQITPEAFADHALPGERFAALEWDMNLALTITERILVDHRQALGSWERALRAYNAGRGNWRSRAGGRYAADVLRRGGD